MSRRCRLAWLAGVAAGLAQLACHAPAAPGAAAPALASARAATAADLVERARVFSASGDHLRAEQYLAAALSQGADERRLLPLLLAACVADQRYRDGLQHVESYVRRHPRDHGARFLLATLQLALGRFERGVEELEGVLAVAPRHAEAHHALAVVLRDQLGDMAGADRHFRAYLRLRPSGSHAEEARGSLLSQRSAPDPSGPESSP
jgi:tetratricopeptide (TPR) repeat protein